MTAQTTKTPQLAFEAIFTDFFSLGLNKLDLTATKTTFKTLLASLGANTAQVDSYVTALQSYLSVVVAIPDAAQSTAMTNQLNAFDPIEASFAESIVSVPIDFFFNGNVRYANFNSKRALSSTAKTGLRSFPSTTKDFFTNPTTAKDFAEYYVEAINVLNIIKSGV